MATSDSDSDSGTDSGTVEPDVLRAFSYGLNMALTPPATTPEQRYRERFTDYYQSLLCDLDADAARLAAVETGCLAELSILAADDGRRLAWETALDLTRAALQHVHDAGVDTEQSRQQLVEQLHPAWEPTPYRQGLLHRHRLLRRALCRLDPRWWAARLAADRVQLVHHEPAGASDHHRLAIDIDGETIGHLDYKFCPACKLAYIGKLSIDDDYQGRGLGTRALRQAIATHPGHTWITSGQYDSAKTFWKLAAKRTGAKLAERQPCQHLRP
jgi:GNAT superfamily N-acetyltransferase